jgi:hypothetical protein
VYLQESVERVQGLLRMAAQQQDDADHSQTQQQNSRRPHLIDFQQNGRVSVLPNPSTIPKSPLASGGNMAADEKEKARRTEEIKRKQTEVDCVREQEDRILLDTSKRKVKFNFFNFWGLHPFVSITMTRFGGAINRNNFYFLILLLGTCGSIVVKALCYELEGHGFDT